jgi:hypothetical protein
MTEIKQSWQDFLKMPFPYGCAGTEVEDIDLASLDTFSAGCIDAFIDREGRLDRKRISVLKNCSRELDKVVSHLDGEAKEYFEHLRILTKQVLDVVSKTTLFETKILF